MNTASTFSSQQATSQTAGQMTTSSSSINGFMSSMKHCKKSFAANTSFNNNNAAASLGKATLGSSGDSIPTVT